MTLTDTVAAVSTPRGKGGVALLRVSGPDAVAVAERVFEAKNGKPLAEIPARMATLGTILIREGDGTRVPVDEALATVFRAPASFTGEDTVELCCHGGVLLAETVLTALFAAGARPAGPGEFTRRAFLNGKLGLSSAEALGDLLEAQSRDQLLLAHSGMTGKTGRAGDGVYRDLRRVLASVYAVIDYPDEDLADLSREEMIAELEDCAARLRRLADTYRTGPAVAEGVRTVICGRPNVGKSSLYNRILGREAAIVTDVEGTTRDLLTDAASLGRVTLRLTDTAGLRETEDRVEKIGVERARGALEDAELILAVFDGSTPPTAEDEALIARLRQVPGTVVGVIGKSDLGVAEETARFCREALEHCVILSALTGEGVDRLTGTVEALFTDGTLDLRQDAILTNARQNAAVLRALENTERAAGALRDGYPVDLCCSDAEAAMAALGELDGREVSEELVSEIFSRFCVGK